MDESRFDALTRRQAGLGVAGIVAGLLGVTTGQTAAAKKKKPKKSACSKKQKQKCRREGFVCEKGKCVVSCNAGNSTCSGNPVSLICGNRDDFCVCSPLAQGGFACAESLDGGCPAASQCASNAGCAQNEVCVDVSDPACCGEPLGVCLKECKGGNIGN